MSSISGNRVSASLDTENHRIIVTPLKPGARMDVPTVLRAMKYKLKFTNKEIAEFSGLSSTHKVFRISFTNHISSVIDEVKKLSEYLVIDVNKDCAYFYDSKHKPEDATAPHVGPVIINGEPKNMPVTERIPVAITTRVTIKDDLNRQLTMKMIPANGYLLGVNDASLAIPNETYVVSGSRSSLNALLRKMHFVPVKAGTGQITISVTDNEGFDNSTASTTVTVVIAAAAAVSVPTLTLPKPAAMTVGKDTALGAITTADKDGKLLSLRVATFNCEVYGFKSFIGVLEAGKYRVTTGRPEVINEEVKNLVVRPLKTNAVVGVELLCGKSVIREYIRLEVSEEGSQETDDDKSGTTSNTSVQTPTLNTVAPKTAAAPKTTTTSTTKTEEVVEEPKTETTTKEETPVEETPKTTTTTTSTKKKATSK